MLSLEIEKPGVGPPERVRGQGFTICQWAAITCFQIPYSMINASMGIVVLPAEAKRLNGAADASVWIGVYLAMCGTTQLACPVAGKISDRCCSRFGRRRPFVLLGTFATIAGFGVLRLASIRIWPKVYLIGLLCAQLALNIAYSAHVGLPADLHGAGNVAFEDKQQPRAGSTSGTASGFVAFYSFLGAFVAMVAVVATRGMPIYYNYSINAVMLFLACMTVCLSVSEMRTDGQHHVVLSCAEILECYSFDSANYPDFFWVCVGRLCYYASTSVAVFFYYYLHDMIHIEGSAELKAHVAILVFTAQIIGALVVVPATWASSRIGRRPVIYGACAVMMSAFFLYIVAPVGASRSWPLVILASLGYGIGNGTYMSVDYALALECMPSTKTAAEAFGLWGIAGFMGTTFGPMIGGLLLNEFHRGSGVNEVYGYTGYALVMFFLGVCMNFLTAIATCRIRGAR